MRIRPPGCDNPAAAGLSTAFMNDGKDPGAPVPPTSISPSVDPRVSSAVCSLALRVSRSALVLFSSDSSCLAGSSWARSNK